MVSEFLFITSCVAADAANRPRWSVSYGPTWVRISYREVKTPEEWADDPRIVRPHLIKGSQLPSKITMLLKICLIHYSDPDFFVKLDKALVRCRSMAIGQNDEAMKRAVAISHVSVDIHRFGS